MKGLPSHEYRERYVVYVTENIKTAKMAKNHLLY